MDQAMCMLEVIAPLRRAVKDNFRRPSPLALSTSEGLVKRAIDKMSTGECRVRQERFVKLLKQMKQ
jgi:hypothetical protein